jgi:outer membrane protein assembly factor BamB
MVEAWVGEGLAGEVGGVLVGCVAGSRVAGYLLEEQVGAGGMAVVFRARDERLCRVVAVKVLSPGLAADENFRRRFIRESRAAAAVENPHIIPVHEAGQAGGVLFIAMRYVPGGDVRTLLRQSGPLRPAQAAAIISAVASALDSAHAAGLVHRDVKPANMLLDVAPGRPDHVYLSDFGLSKGVLSLGLTEAGRFMGTVGYSAPEQIRGRPVDGRADQYALACTAFELLAGTAVFPRDQVFAVMYAHLSEPPPGLTGRRPGTPAAADAVFARALAKEPDDRYASCGEFAGALCAAFGLSWGAAVESGRATADGSGALAVTHLVRASSRVRGKRPAVSRRTVLGLAATAAAGAAVAGWELSRGAGLPRGGTLLWSRSIPAGGGQAGSPMVQGVADGIVYAGTEARQYALGAVTGAKLWSSGSLRFLVLADRGAVCAAGPDGLYGARAADGRTLWHSAFKFADVILQSDPFSVLDRALVCGVDVRGEIYAVDARSGTTIWRFPAHRQPWGLAVAGGVAYLGGDLVGTDTSGTDICAVRAGKEVWHSQVLTSVPGLAVAGNRCYLLGGFGSAGPRLDLDVLRTDDGARSWTFPRGFQTASGRIEPVLVTDAVAYCSREGTVYALSADNGRKLWQFATGRTIVSLAMSTDRDTLYVSSDLAVYALHATSGHEMWRFATSGSGAQVIAAGATVYVAGNDLHAVSADDGRERWTFPVEASVPGPVLGTPAAVGLAAARGAVYFAGTDSRVYAVRA